jgi:periplasmic protein TonB
MKPEMILQADLLDIIFENRNKEYGAYVLRREYNKRLFKSMGGMLIILLGGFLLMNMNLHEPGNNSSVIWVTDTVVLKHFPENPPPPPPPAMQAAKPVAQVKNPPPVIVPDHQVRDTLKTIDDIARAVIGNQDIPGPPADSFFTVNPGPSGGSDKYQEPPVVQAPLVLNEADVMPEFPGGIAGWQRFLQKTLRFPGEPEEALQITVVVKFVVNEDGSLTDMEIVSSGGKDFDQEVLRVMKKSPKWVAGSDKGRKVKIYRKQPVVFKNVPE